MTQMNKQENMQLAGQVQCCRNLHQLLRPTFFKALCDPSRIALFSRLAGCSQPCCVSEMAACCPTDFSVVSRHLALLRDAGILEAQRRGKEVYYRVRFDNVVQTLRAVADAIEACCPQTENGTHSCCKE